MSGEKDDATASTDKGQDDNDDLPEKRASVPVDQESALTRPRPVDDEQEDDEQQFRQTCEKIKEIEERARHALRSHDLEHRCSFCNRPSSEAGSLCQPDQLDVRICLQCAETALELLRQQS